MSERRRKIISISAIVIAAVLFGIHSSFQAPTKHIIAGIGGGFIGIALTMRTRR